MRRLIIYSATILALIILTVTLSCLNLIGWVEIIFTWAFFLPVFVDMGYMAIKGMRQRKVLAIKYLVDLCVHINDVIDTKKQSNENNKNPDAPKTDIAAIPGNIVKRHLKEIFRQIKLLYGEKKSKEELSSIKNNPKRLTDIIEFQLNKTKITEEEKILNNLPLEKLKLHN